MLERFKEHIKKNYPEILSRKVAVACSGGKDSTVLVHLLHACQLKFDIIHCNFNLRGAESDQDEDFVTELAIHLENKVYTLHFDTEKAAQQRGISIQMAARDLRYEAFEEIAIENDIKHVLVAHHMDDQLETFLINLGRGAGIHGLTGIRDRNGIILRPLLDFSSKEIEEYALQNKIKWREDSSNTSTKYLRNKLRHDLIPLLKDVLPHLDNNFSKTLSYLKDSEVLLDVEVARFRESGTTINNGNLFINIEKLKATVQPRAYLFELLREYSFHIDDAMNLLDGENGKFIKSGDVKLIKNNSDLELTKMVTHQNLYEKIDVKNGSLQLPEGRLQVQLVKTQEPLDYLKSVLPDKNKLLIDSDGIAGPLVLRNWEKGDRMSPYGMKGTKLISDFLTDLKITSLKREKSLVLTCDSDIIWLLGIRTSKHYTVTEKTTTILEITIEL
ncbi:tRNA lysidine(34) synthetase TilS [Nonlabens dokdonensis]|uniref:tRNA(Ile)-lysidine synthase n=1 Tax=Nonlabens dokdonensis TaxID=328515 RepID=A0A1Z8BFQ1_9FLAO|nr:tRNA lysidine(34) synthetase TilS [Nonlabens dokdonensis]OUS21413.1 tRNA lysidine(34) synthetase TilS [Nonlabens dokdonensis]